MISKINEIGYLNNFQQISGTEPPSPAGDHTTGSKAPQDHVTISPEARQASKTETAGIKSEEDLSDEEKQAVNQLKKRDAEVKAHEQSHMSAGAGIVQGGASYTFQKGPDGRLYAVGGEVKIDVSPESSPEATITKMQQVKAAALAPAQPSGTDRAVAAQAAQIEAQARMEQMEEAQSDQEIQPFQSDPETDSDAQNDASKGLSQETPPNGEASRQVSSSSKGERVDLII